MLKTAAQHCMAVTTSLQRLPHPYIPQNTVTTSSNRIYYVIHDSFQHKIGVFPYSIEVLFDSISIYIIYCTSVLWNINRYQPGSFKSTGVGKCRLPQIAILDVVSADVVDECHPSELWRSDNNYRFYGLFPKLKLAQYVYMYMVSQVIRIIHKIITFRSNMITIKSTLKVNKVNIAL